MNIRTLHDINKSDEDDNNQTKFFTGGEKSGLEVETPSSNHTAFPKVMRGVGEAPPGSRKVTVYKNGFTIDDGPFRPSHIPENQKFLDELKGGYAPKELSQSMMGGGTVHIALEDRKDQTYNDPVQQEQTLFKGSGFTLSDAVASRSDRSEEKVDVSNCTICVDESKPVTTLQFRFHDGQRGRCQFNQDHTLLDVHNVIMQCAPLSRGYSILYGYPPKELDIDLRTTLKNAELLGECLTQKPR